MWKVTNKFKDVRKFRDGKLGRDVLVCPGKSVETMTPPEQNEVFEVKKLKEKIFTEKDEKNDKIDGVDI